MHRRALEPCGRALWEAAALDVLGEDQRGDHACLLEVRPRERERELAIVRRQQRVGSVTRESVAERDCTFAGPRDVLALFERLERARDIERAAAGRLYRRRDERLSEHAGRSKDDANPD